MLDARTDQAEGLRRLLARERLRTVVMGAAGGATRKRYVTLNLAGALAEQGRNVLILDEAPSNQGVSAALGLRPCFDLEDVVQRRRGLQEAVLQGPGGIRVLPLAGGARTLSRLSEPDRRWLVEQCGRLGLSVDVLLLDSRPGLGATPWPQEAVDEVLMIEGCGAQAITSAYARIKHSCAEMPRRDFHILFSDVAEEKEARQLFRNLALVSRRHLQVNLDYLGHVSPDEKLRDAALLGMPVVAAFPGSSSAAAYRRIALNVAGWSQVERDSGGFDDFMRHLLQSSCEPSSAVFPGH